MTPERAIAKLNRQLAKHGQLVVVRNPKDGSLNEGAVNAFVRGYRPDELVGGITQDDVKVILSPTGLQAWPDGYPRKGAWIEIAGKVRSVLASGPIFLAGELVRIELLVRG